MQITEILLLNTPNSVFAEIDENIKPNQRVVVNIDGSLELGAVKGKAKTDCDLVDFVRIATKEDYLQNCENCRYTRSLLPEIKTEAQKLNLDMKISFISTNLDRTKLIINYTADGRVDFRELIKVLANKYKTKIEMRQIGNRDETKQVGALGVCGRVTCCKAYLSDFDKVSIKMAKNQNISLNPQRINGMCGRLLCCLKYEDEFYDEMQKKMPKLNSTISTPDGKGLVTDRDFLRETVTITFTKDETTEVKKYTLDEIINAKDKK